MRRPYRVVVAKVGLDGHDRGAKVISRAQRDAGFEVIPTGLRQTPEQMAETASQEDADAAWPKTEGLAEEIVTPGTTTVSITEWLAAALDQREAAPA